MTVIAWDGKKLAADNMSLSGEWKVKVKKLFRIGEDWVGAAGSFDYAQELIEWYANGQDKDKFPEFQRGDDTWVALLVVTGDRRLLKYERSPIPIEFNIKTQYAIGSGRDFALAAMHLGYDAKKAAQVACDLCASCGFGVTAVEVL